jgi:hypothetical protein
MDIRFPLAFFALGVCLLATGAGSASEAASDLRSDAQRCAAALMATEPGPAIACMHPSLVKALGGADAATESIDRQRKAMAERGASIESVSIGMPGPRIVVGRREFVLIPQTLKIKTKEGMLRQAGYLLAVRDRGAKTWTFLDATAATPKTLSTLFPETAAAEFEAKLKIPAREDPVLEN